MNIKRWRLLALVPLLGFLLAACGQSWAVSTPYGKATCTANFEKKDGRCVIAGRTYAASALPGNHASGPAVHDSKTPVPITSTTTVTATPSPSAVVATSSPTPQSTFDANAVQAVIGCMNQFPTQAKDTLVSFSTSADARNSMAVCLQMPPQTVALFLKLLFRYAYAAYVRGDFNTTQGQEDFVNTTQGDTLPAVVIKCDKHYTGSAA